MRREADLKRKIKEKPNEIIIGSKRLILLRNLLRSCGTSFREWR